MTKRRDPDLIAERVAAGELPQDELVDASERLAELDESNAGILERYPPTVMGPAIRRRLGHEERKEECFPWWSRFAVAVPVALAAALVMVVMPMKRRMSPIETVRAKGEAQLVLQRAIGGDEREQLNATSVVKPGDRIAIGYRVSTDENETVYGVVVSIDGGGVVTTHLPESGAAEKLRLNALEALPHSYELDEAPRFERFFLVTRAVPFDLSVVVNAANRLALEPEQEKKMLRLPSSFSQTSTLLRKE